MTTTRFLPMIAFAAIIALLAGALCYCPYSPVIDSENTYVEISADANSTITVNISGLVIDSNGYLVISPFRVIILNPEADQFVWANFQDGQFVVPITIPTFAQENQTLIINITNDDGSTIYGSAPLMLLNVNSTPVYEIEIFIANPPPNYSWVWIIIFVVIFGGILAAYAMFTRWMITKMVIRRANEIRFDKWKRQGGGNMQP